MYYVYIMSNHSNTTLYTGVTHDLRKRIWEHKNIDIGGFAKRYNCYKLVYFESVEEFDSAYSREHQIKRWSRSKKDNLIHTNNPEWIDLSLEWV